MNTHYLDMRALLDDDIPKSTEEEILALVGGEQYAKRVLRQGGVRALTQAGIKSTIARKYYLQFFSLDISKQILGISKRTFERLLADERPLSQVATDRLLRTARIITHANKALGSLENAKTWLYENNTTLGGQRPSELLDTDAGAEQVNDALYRLEYGVFS